MVSWIWILSDVAEGVSGSQQSHQIAIQDTQIAEYNDDVKIVGDDWPDDLSENIWQYLSSH